MVVVAVAPTLFRRNEIMFAIVAGAVAFVLAPRHITQLGFYSTVAQVVPVLFVALAFQARTFWIRAGMADTNRRMVVLVAAGLIYAGGECLRVLASGKAVCGDAQLVVTTLTAAITALGLTAINGPHQLTVDDGEARTGDMAAAGSQPASEHRVPTAGGPPGRGVPGATLAIAAGVMTWAFIRAGRRRTRD